MTIQLVIPMAGKGQRFRDAGYEVLKPLIQIHGKTMISIVVNNLITPEIESVTLVALRGTIDEGKLRAAINVGDKKLNIVWVDELTEGPAATVLAAKDVLDENQPLVIANSDQYIDSDIRNFYNHLIVGETNALLTMEDSDPKWSYVLKNDAGFIDAVLEKKVVSKEATVGIYGFTQAAIAWSAFEQMWKEKNTTNGEYYVGPAYSYLKNLGYKAKTFNLGEVNSVMYGLGIPSDLEVFLNSEVSRRAVNF